MFTVEYELTGYLRSDMRKFRDLGKALKFMHECFDDGANARVYFPNGRIITISK